METRLLEYFVTTFEERNVSRASERCHAAQSTVSAGIKALERQLGVTLFVRSTRQFDPTPAAHALVNEARAALHAIGRLSDVAGGAALRGVVRVGAFASMEYYDLPAALSVFHSSHPAVEIEVTTSPTGSSGLIESLDRGRLDIAFTGGPRLPTINVQRLRSFPFVAVLPPHHTLASRKSLALSELLEEPMIDVPAGFGNRVQLEGLLMAMGVSRNIVAEVSELTGVPAWVANGFGIAVIPDAVDMQGCVTRPIHPAIPEWNLSIATAQRPLGAAVAEVVRTLKEFKED